MKHIILGMVEVKRIFKEGYWLFWSVSGWALFIPISIKLLNWGGIDTVTPVWMNYSLSELVFFFYCFLMGTPSVIYLFTKDNSLNIEEDLTLKLKASLIAAALCYGVMIIYILLILFAFDEHRADFFGLLLFIYFMLAAFLFQLLKQKHLKAKQKIPPSD